jgi:hypothetical protein
MIFDVNSGYESWTNHEAMFANKQDSYSPERRRGLIDRQARHLWVGFPEQNPST